jgi:hypothetical protein
VNVIRGSSIVSESKYDTYELGKLSNFVTTAAYGHFTIQELTGKLQLVKYTDVMVDRIRSFENIKIPTAIAPISWALIQLLPKLNAYTKYCNIIIENNARAGQ